MKIWIGFEEVATKIIEWADYEKEHPAAFLVDCPECETTNWARTDDLYMAYDRTQHNLKCKKCGVGKFRPEELKKREIDPKKFKPKQVGWQSTSDKDARKAQKNKRPKVRSSRD